MGHMYLWFTTANHITTAECATDRRHRTKRKHKTSIYSCTSLCRVNGPHTVHLSCMKHEVSVCHTGLVWERDEVLTDADSALAPTLTLLFLSEGRSKFRKIREPLAGTHTHTHTHTHTPPLTLLTHKQLYGSDHVVWMAEHVVRLFYSEQALTSQHIASATEHWPLTDCCTNWLLCSWLITSLVITASAPAWTHIQLKKQLCNASRWKVRVKQCAVNLFNYYTLFLFLRTGRSYNKNINKYLFRAYFLGSGTKFFLLWELKDINVTWESKITY